MDSSEALDFLREFKKALSRGDWEIVQRRAQYARTTEMTPAAIKQVLFSLTPDDCLKGPEEDRDRSGEYLWVFRKDGALIPNLYIKLKILDNHAKVISFHQSLYS